MIQDDGRKAEAKAIPILEVAARLGIAGLQRAGVERVGPCPVCGGRDRFGINPGRGVFVCRSSSSGGDGLALVQYVQGCDFQGALDFLVGEASGTIDPAVVAARRQKMEAEETRRREFEERARAWAIRDAREIWHAAQPGGGTPAEAYLAGRGIQFPTWPPTLRFLPDHPARKKVGNVTRTLHTGPCLVAAIQNAEGKVVAVHQTWIDPDHPGQKAQITLPDGSPAPSKMVRGSKKGGAIRLTPLGTSGVMIMGEGIETTGTALAHGIKPAAAYWVGVDLGNMGGRQIKVEGVRYSAQPDLADIAAWVPPEGTAQLVFIKDGDSDPKATEAKLLTGIRRAQAVRPGLQGWIVDAAQGRDLNDMKMEEINNATN